MIIKRNRLIKISSFSLIIFINVILLWFFDTLLLKFILHKRADSIPQIIEREFPNMKYDENSSLDYGIYLQEGSMVNEIILEHRHHHYDKDFFYNSKGEKNYWIFGDSWGGGINDNEKQKNTITKILENGSSNKLKSLRIISSGSWSPNLMNLAFRKKISERSELPDYITFFIDQTDIGDEICRYRPFVFRDKNGRLIGVARNPNETWGGSKFWGYHEIFGKHRSGILLAFQNIFTRIGRFQMKSGITDCTFDDLLTYQKGAKKSPNGTPVSEYIQYFYSSLSELINEVNRFNSKTGILLVTHDWAQHNLPINHKDYFPNHIKNIVAKIAQENSNVSHINVSLEDYGELEIREVFLYPSDFTSHLINYERLSEIIANSLNNMSN